MFHLTYLLLTLKLEDKLIQKIQKGYRGNFGSTERRFKNANVVDVNHFLLNILNCETNLCFLSYQELPGPGAYIEMV